MSETTYYSGTLTVMTCSCGCKFGLDEAHQQELIKNGETFYCPRGCPRVYNDGVALAEKKLKDKQAELERTERSLGWANNRNDRLSRNLDTEKRRSAALKGHLGSVKKRVKHGVCPCCNRTFKDLARHMGNKHPDFGDE